MNNTPGQKISVIVVMFNSESTIQSCLLSVPETCELVIVDQCSRDDSIALARQTRPDAGIIEAGKNRGFGAGCNLGAANAHGEILIFLNPDAVFLTPECPEILSSAARNQNALVGPRILDASSRENTTARYWSSIASELGEVFLPRKLERGPFRRDIPETEVVYQSGGPVPYVQGSCMAITAGNFWKVNGFDERFFLYREEETLALSLMQIGVGALIDPRAQVSHIGASSTSKVAEFSFGQYYRSEALFFLIKYPKPLALTAIAILWIELVAMAASTPVRKVVGLRADKTGRSYIAAARGVFRGLRFRIVEPPSP